MWRELLWLALGLVLFVVLPLVALYLRRRWLTAQGGLFDCALQLGKDAGVGWSLGLARYHGDQLQWFRAFSLSLRPRLRLQRGRTHYVGRRIPRAIEAVSLFANSNIVTVSDARTGSDYNLAMTPESAMALMSWLESAPPGAYLPRSGESPG
jgi:hypothetical protein